MESKTYKTLGHEISYSLPSSSEEFNKLDPSRPDACVVEASANIVYRSMHPDTRYWFLHGFLSDSDTAENDKLKASLTASWTKIGTIPDFQPWAGVESETGIKRNTKEAKNAKGEVRTKDGVPITTFDESEEKFYDRVIAQLVSDKKFSSEESARAHFDPVVKRIASYVPFDPTKPESTARGPVKLALKYKVSAALKLTAGQSAIDALNNGVFKNIGKTFTPSTAVPGVERKMFTETVDTGTAEAPNVVKFNLPDEDVETLGRLIKEYFDWKISQEVQAFNV